MSEISLPALAVKPPEQQPGPLDQFAKVTQLKSLLNAQQYQQQAQPLELQQKQAETQSAQLQLQQQQRTMQDQQTVMQTIANNNGDIAASLPQLASKVTPQTYMGLAKAHIEMQKSVADLTKTELDNKSKQTDNLLGVVQQAKQLPPDQYQQQWAQIAQAAVNAVPELKGKIDPNKPIPQQSLDQIELGFQSQSQYLEKEKATREAADATIAQNKAGIVQSTLQNPQAMIDQVDQIAPSSKYGSLNARTKAGVQFDLKQGNVEGAQARLKAASEEVGGIEKEINPAVQQGKINVAVAEGKARQAVEGMAKPVYAMDAQGNKTLMNQTDALKSGAKTILPVTEKQVGEDTMLINRLGDVRQKIAQYDQALDAIGKTVSAKDQGNMAALIAKDGLKVGAFGTELPMDRLNAALQKENLGDLSPDAKKLLVSYYNARESMAGYQRVLTGSGRSSDKNMELQLDALPNPSISDPAYAKESIKQFKGNLAIVGQGLPRIPGVKSPEEIEQQVTNPQMQQQQSTDPFAAFGGKSR